MRDGFPGRSSFRRSRADRARRSCCSSAPRARPRPAPGSPRARRRLPARRMSGSRIVNSRAVSFRARRPARRRGAPGSRRRSPARQLRRGAAGVAAQERAGAGGEDVGLEGLAEVVVGAVRETFDLASGSSIAVSIRIDRGSRAPGPAADVEAVSVGQPAVEHEQVVLVQLEQLLRGLDVPDASSQARPGAGERPDDDRTQPRVVLEDQRPHGRIPATPSASRRRRRPLVRIRGNRDAGSPGESKGLDQENRHLPSRVGIVRAVLQRRRATSSGDPEV